MIFGNIKRIIKTMMLIGLIVGITHIYYEIRVGSSLDQISEQIEDMAVEQVSGQDEDLVSLASDLIEGLFASIQNFFQSSNLSLTSNESSQPERSTI